MDTIAVVNRFHHILLSWDYFEICERVEEGGGVVDKLRSVPDTFSSIQEYKEVFEPLLLEEVGAQMLRGVEEGKVLTPNPAVVASFENKDEFTYCKITMEEEISDMYTDSDLVLLCKENPEDGDIAQELHAMGYCEAHEGQQSVRVKFFLTDASQAGNAKGLNRIRAVRTGVTTPGSCWWLLRLGNTSTITREWIALQHCHLVPFSDILMSGVPRAAPDHTHMDIPPGMKEVIEKTCNPYQMEALTAGLDGTPVVLIQGPPGTGKTRTITNLLSVVLHSARKGSFAAHVSNFAVGEAMSEEERKGLWVAASPWLAGLPDAREEVAKGEIIRGDPYFGLLKRGNPMRVSKQEGPKAHVLVCAPSNSALDEIIGRIMNYGLMDKDGRTFAPSIVRVGVNAHHSVQGVALDTIVNSRVSGVSQDTKRMSSLERDRMRIAVLDEASIVGSTLSFSGSSVFHRLKRRFDVVIIDEAAQAVEPSVLVPMVMGAKQVYLVGDPVQLPATVISSLAVDHKYDQSLFKRLQQAGYPVKVLNVQYRMHPRISKFPSEEFYNGQLQDGAGTEVATASPWHEHPAFGPLAFYDVAGKETVPEGSASIVNRVEVEMVLAIYRQLVNNYPHLRNTPSVAVISPYKAQVNLLREMFKKALGEEMARMVDINTIDGFQGREKDITLFSAVRAKVGKSIGFVADERRINVALTRARCSQIIIGNARALMTDTHWSNLVKHCQDNNCFYTTHKPFNEYMTSVLEGKEGPTTTMLEEEEEVASPTKGGKKRVKGAPAGGAKKTKAG